MPKKPSKAKASMEVAAADFPAVRDFLRGYFHQDLEDEYGDPEAAARQFAKDADPAQRQRLAKEWSALLSRTGNLSIDQVNPLLQKLGSAWMFDSIEEVRRVAEISGAASR